MAALISKKITETIEKNGMKAPHLAIIRVGERADDISYENGVTEDG